MGIQVHKVGASIPFPLERLNLRTVSETGRTTAKPEDLLSTRPTCRDHLMDRLSPVETSPNASHERTHVKDSTRRKRPKWAGEHGQIQVLRSRETWNLSGLHHVTFGRLPDANATSPSTGPICSTQFDSSGQVLLTAGLDGHVRIFTTQANSSQYDIRHTFRLEGLSIRKATFLEKDINKVLLADLDSMYTLNVETSHCDKFILKSKESFPASFVVGNTEPARLVCVLGKHGHVSLVSLKSRTTVAAFNAGDHVKGAAFGTQGQDLLTVSEDGTVRVWDLKMNRCRQQFRHVNATGASAIALCPQERLLAIGTDSGIVGLFSDWQTGESKMPTTVKVVNSLTTSIDGLHFNFNGKLMLASSSRSKGAVRIVKTATNDVAVNWPTSHTPLNYVFSSHFHPDGAQLVLGNARGRALLYSLHCPA